MTQQGAVHAMPPQDVARFAEAHRELLADPSIQFTFTSYVPPKIPSWLPRLVEFLTSPLARYIFWGAVALLAVILGLLIVRRLAGFRWPWKRGSAGNEEQSENWRPEAAPARALLREADALAAQGHFDEAAHLLLFRSIEDIEARRPRLVRPALTSRDIAQAPEIPSAAQNAFEAIVMTVERSLFGGHRISKPDWQECRSAYERFAFAEAWR